MSDGSEYASSTDEDEPTVFPDAEEPTPLPVARETKLKIDKGDHAFSILEELDAMRKDGERCDFKVKLGEDTMNAHRTVLSASSKYFKAMMSHDTLESRSGVVEFKDCELESVRKCIDFIYTGEAYVEEENCEKLMHVAHMMQLDRLCDGIGQFLVEKMTPKSFFSSRKLAAKYQCESLLEKCNEFAFHNLGKISECTEFKDLEKDELIELVNTEGSVLSETVKCKLYIRWVKFDEEKHSSELFPLLKTLDANAVNAMYQKHLVDNEPVVYNCAKCLRMFYTVSLRARNVAALDIPVPVTSPTNPHKKRLVVFDSASNSLVKFDSVCRAWDRIGPIYGSLKPSEFTAVASGKTLYVIKNDKSVYSASFQGSAVCSWETLSSMQFEHGSRPLAVPFGNCIYVIGRQDYNGVENVEKFHIDLNDWANIPGLKWSVRESSATSCGDWVYMIGGTDGRNTSPDVARFHPNATGKPTWEKVNPMYTARQSPGVTECRGKIYVAGGHDRYRNYSANMECYDPASGAWTVLTPLTAPHSDFRLLVLDGLLHCISTDKVEVFDEALGEWKYVTGFKEMKIIGRVSVALE